MIVELRPEHLASFLVLSFETQNGIGDLEATATPVSGNTG